MDPSFTVFFLVFVGGVLLALVLRFVQPELIYGLRQVLLQVQTNKLFLDYEAGKLGLSARFQDLLVKDFRYESLGSDERYVFSRINKIRELYRTLDPRRPLAEERLAKGQEPKVCIIELAALLGSLGRRAIPMAEYHQPTVSGRGLLSHIANEIRKSQGEDALPEDDDVLGWFMHNPLSGEQAIEIMIAAAYGLALRQAAMVNMVYSQSERREEPGMLPAAGQAEPRDPRGMGDVLSVIINVEKRMRVMVRVEYQRKYPSEHRRRARIEEVLSPKTYSDCLQRMEESRSGSRGLALEFLDFLYIGQLETLIFGEWELFRRIFREGKAWLKDRVEKIIQVRNGLAHGRDVQRNSELLAVGYCGEIDDRLDVWSRENGNADS